MPVTLSARQVLSQAVLNDPAAVVSERDARALVDAALAELAAAADPRFVFERGLRLVHAARALVGHDADAVMLLANFEGRARRALGERLAELERPLVLAPVVEQLFRGLVEEHEVLGEGDGPLEVEALAQSGEHRWRFAWRRGEQAGEGWAVRVDGRWVIGPTELTADLVHSAERLARSWFDAEVAPDVDWLDEGELAEAREALHVLHALWPDEEDPTGMLERFPLGFRVHNATGSDEGYFIGMDPERGAWHAEAFN